MGNISHALILSLFLAASTCFTCNNAELQVPHTAPAPSPATHHHKPGGHHPGGGHHSGAHAPTVAPAYAPITTTAPPPSKPVIPKPPAPAKAPTTYPTPSVPPVKPPTQPPVKPPTYPPVKPPTIKPPTQPPVKPPTYPPVKPPSVAPAPYSPPSGVKKYVAVQGMVYCKTNCTYAGVDTLWGAIPYSGAKVVMRCRNTKYLLRKTETTNKDGYFFMQAPQGVTTDGAHKCKVYLAHKQRNGGPCTHPAKLHGGDIGVFLNKATTTPVPALPTFSLFTVGPFAFEPDCFKH